MSERAEADTTLAICQRVWLSLFLIGQIAWQTILVGLVQRGRMHTANWHKCGLTHFDRPGLVFGRRLRCAMNSSLLALTQLLIGP